MTPRSCKWQMLLATLLTLLPLAALQATNSCSPGDPLPAPLVQVPTWGGAARGRVMTSRRGRHFAAYLSLPYAKAPVGSLRFKAPVAPEPWEGERDATVEPPLCTQKNYFLPEPAVMGQEDCLYLNVYTPHLNRTQDGAPLPVLVYIHGGGWFSGGSNTQLVGPQLLMDNDIVLVTINYRLGPLGFLSTGDAEAPGNYGLKDQVQALRWVRANARAFGGDARRVTVWGQSAGAASVHLLLLSPATRGLIHRAIAQSGVALDAWSLPERDPRRQATRHGELVNCSSQSTAELVRCLRGVDHRLLVDVTDRLKIWSVDPLTFYRPVVDPPNIPAEEVFLPEDPVEILRHAVQDANEGRSLHHFTKIPLMMGVVQNEGILRAVPIISNPELLAELNMRFDELMPQLLELNRSVYVDNMDIANHLVKDLYHAIKAQFLLKFPLTMNDTSRFIDLYSERGFFHGLQKSAMYHKLAGQKNLFIYSFEYQGSQSYTPVFTKTNGNYGVCHCDDLLYLLTTPAIFPPLSNDSYDWNVVDAMTHLWTQFATTGNPTQLQKNVVSNLQTTGQDKTCWHDIRTVVWPQAGTDGQCLSEELDSLPFLQISGNGIGNAKQHVEFCSHQKFAEDRLSFWNSLPLVENSISKPSSQEKELSPQLVLLLPSDTILPGYWV